MSVGTALVIAGGTNIAPVFADVDNGGFETPVIGSFYREFGAPGQNRPAGSAIGPWQVEEGTVDLVATPWGVHSGLQALDLTGGEPGTDPFGKISQAIPTTPGQSYALSFYMGLNVIGTGAASMILLIDDVQLGPPYSLTSAGRTQANPGYVPQTATFTAQGASTKISFKSLTAGNAGILIDDVSLAAATPVNQPPTSPGVPGLAGGSSTPNQGLFTLTWSPSSDAGPVTYVLEHRNSSAASFTTVAAGLTAAAYTFTAGSPEGEGTWTYRVQASDGSLASGFSVLSAPITVDRTPPPAPAAAADRQPDFSGDGGWYRDAVTVSFADPGDPGLPDGSPGSGVASVTAPVTVTAGGAHQVQGAAQDNAGNLSQTGSLQVQVDSTAPEVALTCPAGPLTKGSAGAALWSATDAHSGLATAAAGSVSLDTSVVGQRTITLPAGTAQDNVGHGSATASCSYAVVYAFQAFASPVDNPPSVNQANAGQAIPLKFSLGGYQGPDIIAAGYPMSQAISCSTSAPLAEPESTGAADSRSPAYDATADRYRYVWKTEKSWAGTCRQFILVLVDGTQHEATFRFK